MKERVQVIHGKTPVILVAPHGADDTYTGDLTIMCAAHLKCNAVINWGFQRSDKVDVIKDLADCNRIDHVEQDVVREEFLDQILRIKKRLNLSNRTNLSPDYIDIYYIHGFGIHVEKSAQKDIDLILGYGQSDVKPSPTCPGWMVDIIIKEWEYSKHATGKVFCGQPGGAYAARTRNNLCQLYTQHIIEDHVRSIQIEVSQRLRRDSSTSLRTGENLAKTLRAVRENPDTLLWIERKYI